MIDLVDADECAAEGFPGHDPGLWRVWWASRHGYGLPAGVDDPDEVLRMVDVYQWNDAWRAFIGAPPAERPESADSPTAGALIDVEALAVGYLAGLAEFQGYDAFAGLPSLPWSSDDLSRALGVEPPKAGERHSALTDARWARRIYENIIGGAA